MIRLLIILAIVLTLAISVSILVLRFYRKNRHKVNPNNNEYYNYPQE